MTKIYKLQVYLLIPGCLFIMQRGLCQTKINTIETVPGRDVVQISTDSANTFLAFTGGVCKAYFFYSRSEAINHFTPGTTKSPEPLSSSKPPLVVFHGNVIYDFNYRSYIDTPFVDKDVMQHTTQTHLKALIADKYPVTVFVTDRRSNSPFFRNTTDVSFQFNQSDLLENIKRKMRSEADSILADKSLWTSISAVPGFNMPTIPVDVQSSYKTATAKIDEITQQVHKKLAEAKSKIEKWQEFEGLISTGGMIDNGIGKKEEALRDKYGNIKQSSIDNLLKSGRANEKIKKLAGSSADFKKKSDSLKYEALAAAKDLKDFQKKLRDSLNSVRHAISQITDPSQLQKFLRAHTDGLPALNKAEKVLLAVKQLGIGRTWIDYSELTVKNISLNGINVEANPGNLYVAAAAGKVNYRFRDYVLKGNFAGSGQSVGLVRLGIGKKEKNNFIVTYYSGRKAVLNQNGAADSVAVQNIAGVSFETRFAINNHSSMTAEYAKSINPVQAGKIFDLSNSANEAFSLKFSASYPQTRLNAFYRRTGESFQSFTLFPSNNKNDAWSVKLTQTLLKKKLLIDAGVRKNDFESLITDPKIKSNILFKSLQLTARIPHYPFVTVGYYPSTQLTLSNNRIIYENQYNTFCGLVSHSYSVRKLHMNSNLSYTRFFNNSSDTGVIYYNTSTVILDHNLNPGNFMFRGIATKTFRNNIHETGIEQITGYRLKNKIFFTAGIKWIKQKDENALWGCTGGVSVNIRKTGFVRVQYQKIYLPGYSRNLIPTDIGRLTYTREF